MRRQDLFLLLKPRRRQRGAGLFDAVIALAVLAFGMGALSRLQARMVTQSTDAQVRLNASRMADELLSMVVADSASAFAGCYTLPSPPPSCSNSTASTDASNWKTAALASLPGTTTSPASVSATLNAASGLFQVTLQWAGKETRLGNSLVQDLHNLTVATDVRQ